MGRVFNGRQYWRRKLVIWMNADDEVLIELYGGSYRPLVWRYRIDDPGCFKKAREIIWSICEPW